MNQPTVDPVDPFEILGTARAMRWFRPDPVPVDLLERLVWAATRAPSPDNTQAWEFVVVTDPDVRREVGELVARLVPPGGFGAVPQELPAEQRRTRAGAFNLLEHLGDVPALIFVCAADIYPAQAPEPEYAYAAMHAAAQNLLIAARASGLGAAFTTIHRLVEPDLRVLLGIPADRLIGVTIPIGWPDRPFGPVRRRPVAEVIHHDRW